MPELSRFFGIVIRMFYNDHSPPHFHAVYGDHEALIEIDTLGIYRGELPRRVFALVLEWAVLHREELRRAWALARSGRTPERIEPLEWEKGEGGLMSLVRIRDVIPLEGFRLRLTLTDGTTVERDVSQLLVGPILEAVKSDRTLYCRVHVQDGTVVWPNGADLCPDVVIWGGPPPAEAEEATPEPTRPGRRT